MCLGFEMHISGILDEKALMLVAWHGMYDTPPDPMVPSLMGSARLAILTLSGVY